MRREAYSWGVSFGFRVWGQVGSPEEGHVECHVGVMWGS